MVAIKVKINGRVKYIGELTDSGAFIKKVVKSKHLFRKSDAWGFDYVELVNHILPQVNFVFVHDTEENLYYFVSHLAFGHYTQEGKFKPSKSVEIYDFKHGVQVFLPRRYWKVFNKGQYDRGEWR